MNHGTLATAMRLAVTDSRHMKASSPISNPATTPAIVHMTVALNLAGKKYRDLGSVKGAEAELLLRAVPTAKPAKLSMLSISRLLPRETIRAMSAQATAPALAWASATRHAMLPTGTSTVQSQLYKVQTG